MLQTEVSEHRLQMAILLLQFFESLDIGRFHAAILGFPVVIGGVGYPIFPAHLFDQSAAFYFLQNPNDLRFRVA